MLENYMKQKFGQDFDPKKYLEMQLAQKSNSSQSDSSINQLTMNSRMEDHSSHVTMVTSEDLPKAKARTKESQKAKK